ncbi:hypothetical protein G9P44_000981 [Scheffersomyces stipitis]|nr:hypothetical protein G9P44_000981 [Scheffersomyces stipitis]
MDSRTIVSKYILDKPSLEESISQGMFRKLFPSKTSKNAADRIFIELCKQREETCLKTIQENIEESFQFPVKILANSSNVEGVNKISISDLNGKLENILGSILTTTNEHRSLAKQYEFYIKSLIDELSDLKYSNNADLGILLEEACRSLDKLKDFLLFDT